jgi:hypothetical protein
VRLLADQADYKKSLKPAAERWVQQFGQTRPLSVRLAAAKTLQRRKIEIAMLPDDLDVRLVLDRSARLERDRRRATLPPTRVR